MTDDVISPPIKKETDPRFTYRSIRPKGITIEQLDQLAAFVFSGTTNFVMSIIAACKLAVALAYIWAREKMVSAEAEALKQEYEQSQAGRNQDRIDRDNLGTIKKP